QGMTRADESQTVVSGPGVDYPHRTTQSAHYPSRATVVRKILLVFVMACGALPASAADVSDLIKKLKSDDNEVRRGAAKELSELGKQASPAVDALTNALRDKDRFVRRFSAQALGKIGPDAKSAMPELAKLLTD